MNSWCYICLYVSLKNLQRLLPFLLENWFLIVKTLVKSINWCQIFLLYMNFIALFIMNCYSILNCFIASFDFHLKPKSIIIYLKLNRNLQSLSWISAGLEHWKSINFQNLLIFIFIVQRFINQIISSAKSIS